MPLPTIITHGQLDELGARVALAVFEVRTPHLAVVVKGTSFTITVTPHETKVVVVEGVVGVSDPLTGDAVDLGAGQSVVRGIVEQAGLVVETISASSNQLISKTTDALADTGLAVEQSLEAVATGLAATLEVPLATTGVESSGGGSSGGGASSGGSSGGGSSGGGSVRDSARDTVSRTRDSVSGALGL